MVPFERKILNIGAWNLIGYLVKLGLILTNQSAFKFGKLVSMKLQFSEGGRQTTFVH